MVILHGKFSRELLVEDTTRQPLRVREAQLFIIWNSINSFTSVIFRHDSPFYFVIWHGQFGRELTFEHFVSKVSHVTLVHESWRTIFGGNDSHFRQYSSFYSVIWHSKFGCELTFEHFVSKMIHVTLVHESWHTIFGGDIDDQWRLHYPRKPLCIRRTWVSMMLLSIHHVTHYHFT